ncbi:HD domain-containing protein [Elizabethkingia argentiflava]|uniref:HD domain-containing protein n=1 Tax=Elizabethkingia argenteiflava TaxID=2681556 RepID=A0A845PTY5_9FLAO|nr:HD domain-containing protein [Elizabethkingia argenteiflava]NAW51105.1 HD domain-containing protein [Elizabethkingia argenteiflava]
MTKEEQLHRAIKIAVKAHKGQKDKYDAPYINHVLRVSNMGKTLDEKIVGALHDVVEDSQISLSDLIEKGFSPHIVEAVRCITKTSEEEDYSLLIQRIETNALAIAVKINDLIDNMDLKRMPRLLTDNDLKRFNKYIKYYRYLIAKY